MIFAGDFYQYPPVMGASLCTPIKNNSKQTEAEFKKRFGRMAWKTVDTVVELTEQHRMKRDPGYADAVLRLRSRNCTFEDVDLFNSRVIRSATHPNGIDMSTSDNQGAAIIVKTNIMRQILNVSKARSNCAQNNQNLEICAANDTVQSDILLTNVEYGTLLKLDFSSSKYQKALPGFISLYIGMPVILRTRNLSTELKIANGSQGYVREILMEVLSHGVSHCKCVIVEFTDSPMQLMGLPKGYFPITTSTFSFTTHILRDTVKHKIKVTRNQLPIQPAFAVTGHSAQGKSLPKILTSLHEGGFAAYVAASRAFDREGLCITHPVQLSDLNKPLPQDVFNENRRLKALEHNTSIRFGFISGSSIHVPDPETEKNLDMSRTFSISYTDSTLKRKYNDQEHHVLDNIIAKEKKRPKINASENSISIDTTRSLPLPFLGTINVTCPRNDFISGCSWSSDNYSCAYDTIFMTFFSIYRSLDDERRIIFRHILNEFGSLGDSLEILMEPERQNVTQFNLLRDRLRDHLSSIDPINFRRYGRHGAPLSLILEMIVPRTQYKLNIYGRCTSTQCGNRSKIGTDFLQGILAVRCSSDAPCSLESNHTLDVGEHLTKLLNQVHRGNAMCSCGERFSETMGSLINVPQVLFFELQQNDIHIYAPPIEMDLPTSDGVTKYRLLSVIYLGGFHYTCRLFTNDGRIWEYDGRDNQGCPTLEDISVLPTESFKINHLRERSAHIFVYTKV